MNALVYEVLRWAPVAPMGIPHVNSDEVEWEGRRIPSGSVVIANIWAYAHDKNVYELIRTLVRVPLVLGLVPHRFAEPECREGVSSSERRLFNRQVNSIFRIVQQ